MSLSRLNHESIIFTAEKLIYRLQPVLDHVNSVEGVLSKSDVAKSLRRAEASLIALRQHASDLHDFPTDLDCDSEGFPIFESVV